MKKIFFIIIPVILIGYILIITLLPRTKSENVKPNDRVSSTPNVINTNKDMSSDHVKQVLNCKSCHTCESPTKKDPCLIDCPRSDMVSIFHSTKEGPDVVVLDQMSDNYTGVVFSHKIHSQMSEMSAGCTNCHHYNTTGPILSCRACHENIRTHEDKSVPDLKAAYHRQCTACHMQWSHENGCNSQCHLPRNSTSKITNEEYIQSILNRTHPVITEPAKLVWETNYDEGKTVTFFHDEHNKLFKIECKTCHSQDNCTKCHDANLKKDISSPVKINKTVEEHHKPCSSCHNVNNTCQKCHGEKELLPFNHGRSVGWTLKSYHSQLTCAGCHGNDTPKKLDRTCTSCHKNFVPGKFDHKKTGLVLSESHKDIECKECHTNNDFSIAPICKNCHDDKSYPSQSPGNKGKK
jgi:hypothetical protein